MEIWGDERWTRHEESPAPIRLEILVRGVAQGLLILQEKVTSSCSPSWAHATAARKIAQLTHLCRRSQLFFARFSLRAGKGNRPGFALFHYNLPFSNCWVGVWGCFFFGVYVCVCVKSGIFLLPCCRWKLGEKRSKLISAPTWNHRESLRLERSRRWSLTIHSSPE